MKLSTKSISQTIKESQINTQEEIDDMEAEIAYYMKLSPAEQEAYLKMYTVSDDQMMEVFMLRDIR